MAISYSNLKELLQLTNWSIRDRRSAMARAARAAGTSLRNEKFQATSPLPVLTNPVLESIYGWTPLLPPGRLLGDGNQSLEGLIFIVSLAATLDVRRAFEIGTYNGLTAWSIAQNAKSSTVHTLDIPKHETPALEYGPSDQGNKSDRGDIPVHMLDDWDRVHFHIGDSARFDFSEWYGTCDLVYIDGAHSYDYVRNDSGVGMRLVTNSGVIIWDDYWPRLPGVVAYLHELLPPRAFRVPGTRLVCYFGEDNAFAKELQ